MRYATLAMFATTLVMACGGADGPTRETDPGIVPLTEVEAQQLKTCVKALNRLTSDSDASTVEGALIFADACVPGCDGRDWDKKDAWISYAESCAAGPSKRLAARELVSKGATWLAKILPRARFSHPVYAQRLELAAPHAAIPLPLDSAAPGLYQLPSARVAAPSPGRIFVVVTERAARVGMSNIARVDLAAPTDPAQESFPGKIARLDNLSARIAKRESWEGAGRPTAPLLLADRRLPAARLRQVIAVLAEARLGVASHGYALTHPMPVQSTPVPPIKMPLLVVFPSHTEIQQGLRRAAVRNLDSGPDTAAIAKAIAGVGGVPQAGLAVAVDASTTVGDLVGLLDFAEAQQVPRVILVDRP